MQGLICTKKYELIAFLINLDVCGIKYFFIAYGKFGMAILNARSLQLYALRSCLIDFSSKQLNKNLDEV